MAPPAVTIYVRPLPDSPSLRPLTGAGALTFDRSQVSPPSLESDSTLTSYISETRLSRSLINADSPSRSLKGLDIPYEVSSLMLGAIS